MYLPIYVLVIVGLLIVTLLFKSASKKKNLSFPKGMPLGMNTEQDLAYLHYIIDHKVNILEKHISLTILRKAGYSYDFEETYEDLVYQVYKSLSQYYLSILSKYMTEEALMEYMGEQLYVRLLDLYTRNHLGSPITADDISQVGEQPKDEPGQVYDKPEMPTDGSNVIRDLN